MAVDPSIALQAGQGVPQIQQPMQLATNFMALQDMATQSQLGQGQLQTQQLQQQQLRKQIQDTQDLQQTIRTAYANGQDPLGAIQKLGTPTSMEYGNKLIQMKTNGFKLDKDQFDLANAKLDQAGRDLLAVTNDPTVTPQTVQAHLQTLVQQGLLNPDKAQELASGLPSDPKALPLWGRLQATKMNVAMDVLQHFIPQTKVENGSAVTTDPLTGQITGAQPIPGMPLSEVAKELQDYNASSGKTPVGINDPRFLKWHQQMYPNMATIMQGSMGGAGSPSQPLPAGQEEMAQAIAAGRQPMLTPNIRTPGWQAINARAGVLAGGQLPGQSGVAAQTAGQKSFAPGGTNGQTLINLDTAIHHFDSLGQAVQALGDGDTQGLNRVGNYLSSQFGDPKVTNFDTVKTLAADEFAKVAAGAQMGESDRAAMQKLFSSSSSPQQLTQAIQKAQQLMGGKVQGLNQAYQQLYPGHDVGERVSLETNQVLQGMGIKFGQGGAGQGGQSTSLQTLAPADAAKLPAGTHFLGQDGIERVAHGLGATQNGAPGPVANLSNLHTNGKQTIGWNGSAWVDTKTGQAVQ